jgi:4'-phosphopantetheinyl transferase
MDVYWLEQSEADLPPDEDWLSPGEAAQRTALRFAKRRADWLLGRWTAKCAVAAYLGTATRQASLADIEIRPAHCGAPEVFIEEKPAAAAISISHRAGTAMCAVTSPGVALGCDLEAIEPRSDAFVTDYFTPEEHALLARASGVDRSRLLALLWSAKESTLKALRVGLRLDTRCVTVSPEHGSASDAWHPMYVRQTNAQTFRGWWSHTGKFVRTLVADPSTDAPILLVTPAILSPVLSASRFAAPNSPFRGIPA